ncbi:MAG: BadF/BadG/BcrA/BcrD ATPase family protein [Terriglobia bacterium]|nr:BadF/BadG/BcrA/BcrD ATPase family protein [Terriglobia bacterium]
MEFFLGIDAGATKTQCVLSTGSDVLARAQAGSIKITRVDEASADTNLEAILSSIATQSGVTLDSIIGTCVGLSGIAIPSVVGWVRALKE